MGNTKIQRRTLVKGAAWATPVVIAASSVPAYAASKTPNCTNSDILIGTYAQGTFDTSTYTYPMSALFANPTGNPINATITTERTVPDFGLLYKDSSRKGYYSATGTKTYELINKGTEESNMTLASTASRCGASQAIMLSQESRQNAGQTVTFKFTEPISSAQFTIYDIDQVNGAYSDKVEIATNNGNVNFTFADSTGDGQVTLANNGTSATATAISGVDRHFGGDSACFHPMRVTICANTTEGFDSFTLTYTSAVANAVLANQKYMINQMISIGTMEITPSSCTPSTCGGSVSS